jgi:predicted RNA binding protein YcfA (HicA-like mRNA interferase family)
MPRKLRRLSGEDVAAMLRRFGFERISQKGSHRKLRRLGPGGAKQTLVIPIHDELDRGTLRAIIRQASQFIAEDELSRLFYTDDDRTR